MTTPLPAVTVIIPTFNWSTVLPYSIGSVLRQTFTNFELLVVGDGCTDDSEAVVGRMTDPRVRWINLPANTGHQAGPNNEALRQARGDVIAYLGHDDLWLPHHLSCLVAVLADGYDLAYGVTEIIEPEGKSMEPAWPLAPYQPGMWIAPTGIIHRRRVTEDVGGWRDPRDLSCDPEVDLWQRAFQAGHRFAFVARLTSLKFPASHRRDVYKLRPHHEQEAWSRRIENEPCFESVELVRLLVQAQHAVWQARGAASPGTPMPTAKGAEVEERRKFKGLA